MRPDRASFPAADADAASGACPDRIYDREPVGDLGVEDTGPIGPLVALVGAERRTFWGESTAARSPE